MSEMWNVFDKPDEQNEARFNSAMARKGGMKFNLWHGCHKGGTCDVDNIVGGYQSEGCQHCYVFRRDAEFEKDWRNRQSLWSVYSR